MSVLFALRVWFCGALCTSFRLMRSMPPCVSKSKQGAAMLDKFMRDDIWKLDPRALLARFNLCLYAGYQPAEFRRSRTVLIPKVPEPFGPGEFRSIAMSSYVSRVFHWLLAGRLSGLLEFNSRQRAFVKGDGIADNVFLLR